VTASSGLCPRCGATATRADRFCENCGTLLAVPHRVSLPRADDPIGDPCADCGNQSFTDGYCTVCGHRAAAPDRDEIELGGIALISDRGRVRARNEDAAAAGVVDVGADGPRFAIAAAVCDGVATAGDAHTAAAVAANAGVDTMLRILAASGETSEAALAGLTDAAEAAGAVRRGPAKSPACTYTAAAVVPTAAGTTVITVANVGDSRAYWLPEDPAVPQLLTSDDSLARELIAAGVAPDSRAVLAGAHTLTRWLGADARIRPTDSDVTTITATGPGVLLLCSDGLWNYFPGADDIGRLRSGGGPADTARTLVARALESGGGDNITVVVIPIGGSHEFC